MSSRDTNVSPDVNVGGGLKLVGLKPVRANPLPAGGGPAVFGVQPHRDADAADLYRSALQHYVGKALYDVNCQGGVVYRPGYAGGSDDAADSFFPERSDHACPLGLNLTLSAPWRRLFPGRFGIGTADSGKFPSQVRRKANTKLHGRGWAQDDTLQGLGLNCGQPMYLCERCWS